MQLHVWTALLLVAGIAIGACRTGGEVTPAPPAAAAPQDRGHVVESGSMPVLLSGLTVDDQGRAAVVAARGEQGGYWAHTFVPGAAAPQWSSATPLLISADDALLVDGTLWLAGQAAPHSLASSLWRLAIASDSQAALAAPATGAPDSYRWRLASGRNRDGVALIVGVGAPVDRAQRATSGAVLAVHDATTLQPLRTLLIRDAESCAAVTARPLPGAPVATDDWTVAAVCRGHDGAPLLVTVTDAGVVHAARATPAEPLGQALAGCLGAAPAELVDLSLQREPLVAACAGAAGNRRCTVARIEATAVRCVTLPATGAVDIDRIAVRTDGRVLGAGRGGGLWQFDLVRDRADLLRPSITVAEVAPPMPAWSPSGRYLLLGVHGLESTAGGRLIVVDTSALQPH